MKPEIYMFRLLFTYFIVVICMAMAFVATAPFKRGGGSTARRSKAPQRPIAVYVKPAGDAVTFERIQQALAPFGPSRLVATWDDADFIWKIKPNGITRDFAWSLARGPRPRTLNIIVDNLLVQKQTLFNAVSANSSVKAALNLPPTAIWYPASRAARDPATTFMLPTAEDAPAFGHTLYIVKPVDDFGGEGIDLLSLTPETAAQQLAKYHSPRIVQKYLESPRLLWGRKFDLRVLWLCFATGEGAKGVARGDIRGDARGDIRGDIGCNPRGYDAFVFEGLVVRACRDKYDPAATDMGTHLTNTAQQNKDLGGTYAKLDDLVFDFKAVAPDDYATTFEAIKQQLWLLGQCLPPRSSPASYQLMGADFILDAGGTPWLLEVNFNPGLPQGVPNIAHIYDEVLRQTVQMAWARAAGLPLPDTTPDSAPHNTPGYKFVPIDCARPEDNSKM